MRTLSKNFGLLIGVLLWSLVFSASLASADNIPCALEASCLFPHQSPDDPEDDGFDEENGFDPDDGDDDLDDGDDDFDDGDDDFDDGDDDFDDGDDDFDDEDDDLDDEDDEPSNPTRDSDRDGLIDQDDECPQFAGPINQNGCPQFDSDGDGIFDDADRCPDELGIVRYNGCAEDPESMIINNDDCPDDETCPDDALDSDGDGIPDDADRCVNVAGIADLLGCPIPTSVGTDVVEGDIILNDIDGDHIPDTIDDCPDEIGTRYNTGCAPQPITELEPMTTGVGLLGIDTDIETCQMTHTLQAEIQITDPSQVPASGGHPTSYITITIVTNVRSYDVLVSVADTSTIPTTYLLTNTIHADEQLEEIIQSIVAPDYITVQAPSLITETNCDVPYNYDTMITQPSDSSNRGGWCSIFEDC